MVQKDKRIYQRPAKTGYKKIVKALNVPKDTFGSKVHKFKVKGTVVTLEGA